jgi:hypothetical protein
VQLDTLRDGHRVEPRRFKNQMTSFVSLIVFGDSFVLLLSLFCTYRTSGFKKLDTY